MTRRRRGQDNSTGLELYDRTARAAASTVIERYSTSFGVGARLLPRAQRTHIEAIYALVRVADEIVDTFPRPGAGQLLGGLEAETCAALDAGRSANLVVHAFAATAREVGIGREQVEPFFASMRADLTTTVHTEESLAEYIFGSAEVVGEMCLAVFLNTGGPARPLPETARAGARRLGAAYQKVNFLRDLAVDDAQLGRSYFPGITARTLTDEQVARIVAECRGDIAAARACLPALPRRARVAVGTTIDIYSSLLAKIAATPAARLVEARVRVANPAKLAFAARNLLVVPTGGAA